MLKSKAASRYAKAFFDIAKERNSLDEVNEDFGTVAAAIECSAELKSFLKIPLVSSEKRISALKAIFAGKVSDLTIEFIEFLVKKNRVEVTYDTAIVFSELHDEFNNIQRISITSAFPMADTQVSAVTAKFKAELGKEIIAEVKVVPELIGGFKVQVGDLVHDLSIKSQLNKLKQQVAKA